MLARAFENEDGTVSDIVPLMALVGRMRLASSRSVIEEAEKTIATVLALYDQPAVPLRQLRDSANPPKDPLKAFSDACRPELGRA